MALASTKSTSPPEGVQARPTATPGPLGALFDFAFGANLDAAQKFLNDFLRDHQLLALALGQSPRLLAADGADGALQAAHARFARVVTNDIAQSFVGNSICSVVIPFSSTCRGTR
jgi:hypothetical protein